MYFNIYYQYTSKIHINTSSSVYYIKLIYHVILLFIIV